MAANKKPRKAYKPKYAYLPTGIPGLPIGHEANPASDSYTKHSIDRIFTAERNPSDWNSQDMNNCVMVLNTAFQLFKVRPEYFVQENVDAKMRLGEILESIRARKIKTGHFGITGDEWADLKALVTAFQAMFGEVPLASMARAESMVFARHQQIGSFKYEAAA